MRLLATALLLLCALPATATTHSVMIDPVDFDRWMYPFNGTPGTRNLASTFGAVAEAPDFDNKDGQVIIAVDTVAAGIPAGQGPGMYNAITVRVTLSHFDGVFAYDPSYDGWRTYLDPLHPSYLPDTDAGRPIELYGVGFRNGYASPIAIGPPSVAGPPDFEENEAYCAGCGFFGQGVRNVFPWAPGVPDPEGDVSNNVVRLAPLTGTGFDPEPFAIGQSTSGLAPGATVPQGTFNTTPGETFEFLVDTSDPAIRAYVQQGLDAGVLAFAVVSMHEAEEQQGGQNPNFYMTETTDVAALPPTVEIDVTLPEPGAGAGLLAGVAALAGLTRRRARGLGARR